MFSMQRRKNIRVEIRSEIKKECSIASFVNAYIPTLCVTRITQNQNHSINLILQYGMLFKKIVV